jgi:hypothetical protein
MRSQAFLVLENDHAELQEAVSATPSVTMKDGQRFSTSTRLMVFSCLVNQVPTENIPTLIKQMAGHFDLQVSQVPSRSAVENMMRELGVIAKYQVAEMLMNSEHVTVGFDATTQEDIHVNEVGKSIHFSSVILTL